MHFAAFGRAQAFDRDGLAHALGEHSGIIQDDHAAERMADKPDGELIDDVEQGRQIENVLDEAVHCAGRPSAVPVASQIERIYVVMFAQRAGDPVPVARVIQAAVTGRSRRNAKLVPSGSSNASAITF